MLEKKVIIHPDSIDKLLNRSDLSRTERRQLKTAQGLIKSALDSAQNLIVTDDIPIPFDMVLTFGRKFYDGDVYLVREDDPILLKDCVQPGDHVTVFGAFRGLCVDTAVEHIKATGAIVKVSKEGTVS